MKHTVLQKRIDSKINTLSVISCLLSIALFLVFSTTFAQKLSDEQINKYLNDLQKEQIISEFGKDNFLKTINQQNKTLNQRVAGSPLGMLGKIPDSLSKSRAALLGFIGAFELMRNVGSAADEMIQVREMAEKMLGEKMFFKPILEGAINAKNPLTFLGAELDLRPVKENYLALANRLKAINLIDQQVYNELLVWLKKDQIKLVKDFGFFIYAAKQTYFYDNYEALKAQQFKFIDSLQVAKLLQADKAKSLMASYKPFELKSKVEMLENCENTVIITSEQGNLTREEIYKNLFTSVKNKLISELNFSNLKITEIAKNEDDNRIPFDNFPLPNPIIKDKKAYKLSYKINELVYSQKVDTDFAFIKTLKKNIPPDVNIDSTVIKTYANIFSIFTGIGNKDFKVINDFLADKNSNKRLIVVSNDFNPLVSFKDSRKILLLVDSTQNTLFGGKIKDDRLFANLFGEKVDFSNQFNREKITALIEDYQKNEILPKLTNADIENAIADFRFEPYKRRNIKRHLLLGFPQVIAKINFSPKRQEEKAVVFKNFMAELSKISGGKFLPEKVTDNFEESILKESKKEKTLKISYRLNNKKYEKEQEVRKMEDNVSHQQANIQKKDLEYLDNITTNKIEWLTLVNHSLRESQIDGQFYSIPSYFEASLYRLEENFIFLNKAQFNYVEKNHVEVFKDTEKISYYNNLIVETITFDAEVFAKALQREKMLSEEKFKATDLKKAKEPSALLENSGQAVVIDMNELSGMSNTELYTYVINKIAVKLLPEAKFSEIKYLKDDFTDTTDNDFTKQNISAFINTIPYEQTLNVSLRNTIKEALDSLKNEKSQYLPSIGENQFKIINDYLTDVASQKRLVVVCDYRSPKLSFVLFDSTQANLVAETLPNNYVDFSMYSRQFSRDSLAITLNEFSQMGLIEKMSAAETEAFILKFRRTPMNGISFLENLPKVVVQSNIWDVESYKYVYKNIMDSLKKLSKNQFIPTDLTDNFAKVLKKGNYTDRNFKYSFVFNNKKYEESQVVPALPKAKNKKAKISYEVFDFDTMKLLNLVNQALIDSNTDNTFYQIYGEEQDDSVGPKFVFLSSKQYRWIKTKYPEVFEVDYESNSPDVDEIKEEK